MPAPARKTAEKAPARKAAAPAKRTPAEAAVAEALGENDTKIHLRGQDFVIKGETRASFRYAMAIASGNDAQILFELVSPEDRARLFAVARPGESFVEVATDFFEALAEASGEGNS